MSRCENLLQDSGMGLSEDSQATVSFKLVIFGLSVLPLATAVFFAVIIEDPVFRVSDSFSSIMFLLVECSLYFIAFIFDVIIC